MQKQTFQPDESSEPPICCICLDEFTSPVSLPCGHFFCLACIGEYWRVHGAYQCPLCKVVFPSRPQLKIDQTLRTEGAAVHLKVGEVSCDLCQAKCRAVKSCLVCMASYCDAHLALHYQSEELGRHLLISVVKNLEDSVCKLHGKKLNSFCRSDRSCICAICAQTEHRGHRIVSNNREALRKKGRLQRRKSKLQQAIQDKQSKVEKIKLCRENPKESWAQDKEQMEQLEGEISELQRRDYELEQLTHIDNNLHFLQAYVVAEEQQIIG